MRLLVDTDAFCKLAVAGMLRDAVGLLGAGLVECGRLPALPYMLRKGRLRKTFGRETCDRLINLANKMPLVVDPSDAWLDKLTPVQAIDPGEAQIFASAAETGLIVLSGDKRALRALKDVEGFSEALAERIVVLEAILLALCDHLGLGEVRRRINHLIASDKVVQICFATVNPDPGAALMSYYNSLADELAPLILWDPRAGGGA